MCGVKFDDYEKEHRKYICKECWNKQSKKSQRKLASTLEGYFTVTLRDIKNNPRRNKYNNNIDLKFLMDLYELQEGRCAVSNIKMTWGYRDNDDERKQFRSPLNVSIDRLDGAKGYTKDNVVLVCSIINFFKSNNDMDIVYDVSQEIINHKDRLGKVIEQIHKKFE